MSESTVQVGGMEVTSNTESAAEMMEALKPKDEKSSEPKAITDRGEPVKQPDHGLSKAASELGKAGGKAAAEKRATEAKETEKAPPRVETKPEFKPEEAKPGKEAKAPDREAAKAKLLDYFNEHPDSFPSDAAEALEIDPEEAEAIAQELVKEDKLEAVEVEEKDRRGDPRFDARARVREATREAAELRRRAEAAEARLAEAERRTAPEKPPAPPVPQGGPPKPRAQDFPNNWEGYLDARDKWNRDMWNEEARRQHVVAEQDRRLAEHINRFAAAAKPVLDQCSADVQNLRPEFQLAEGERPTAETWIANELVFSPDRAGDLMLYLSEHPDEFDRLAALPSPRAVSREMAKLEAKLESPGAVPLRREPSKAPPPMRPLKPSSVAPEADIFEEGLEFDSFLSRKRSKRA